MCSVVRSVSAEYSMHCHRNGTGDTRMLILPILVKGREIDMTKVKMASVGYRVSAIQADLQAISHAARRS